MRAGLPAEVVPACVDFNQWTISLAALRRTLIHVLCNGSRQLLLNLYITTHDDGCCCAQVSPLWDFVLPLKARNVFSCVVYVSQLLAVQRWCIERLAGTGIFVKEVKYHSRVVPLYWRKKNKENIRLKRNVQRERNFRKTSCACLKWTLRSSAGRLALRSSHLWLWTPNFELGFSLNVQGSAPFDLSEPVWSTRLGQNRSSTEQTEHLSCCGAPGAHLFENSPFGSL